MRAPFSEMLPDRRGVSIFTRGVAAIAVSRSLMPMPSFASLAQQQPQKFNALVTFLSELQ